MSSYNYFFMLTYIILIVFCVYLFYKRDKSVNTPVNISNIVFNRIYTVVLPVAIIVIGFILRLYKTGLIPSGIHQDEASIGYEAYILSAFGIDRNGYHFPVYPITYGSGGGSPLMVYLTALMTKILGVSVFSLRFLPAFLGGFTLVVFFFLVRTLSAESVLTTEKGFGLQYVNGEYLWIPLISLTILTLCPWHIMLSRWSLDSNTTPFWVSLGLILFSFGIRDQRESTSFNSISPLFSASDRKKSRLLSAGSSRANLFFVLSAIVYAMTMYSYGSATIVIPIHLLIICIFCIKKGKMTPGQMILGILIFLIVSMPLIVFYIINLFNLPEIITPFFSIGHFTSSRSVFVKDGVLISIAQNLYTMLKNLTIGNSSEQILNYIPGFAPLYSFTFPAAIVGVIASFVRAKRSEDIDVFMLSIFVPAILFGLFVEEDINRMVLVFLPWVYFTARGYIFFINELVFMKKRSSEKIKLCLAVILQSIAPLMFMVASVVFIKTYFLSYNSMSSDAFMDGYGNCCALSEKLVQEDKTIYSTYEHLSAPFMVALYYTKTAPSEFIQTVHYKDENAEFRIADSFGDFVFSLPDDIGEKYDDYLTEGNVFILHESELSGYNLDSYSVTRFGNFAVISFNS